MKHRIFTTGTLGTSAFALLAAGLLILVLALSLAPALASGITPTNQWADFYSYHVTFQGVPAPLGTYVAAFDPQGTQCAERTMEVTGWLAPVMPCYGDDLLLAGDQGAVEGDLISFTVNGLPATAVARKLNGTAVEPTRQIRWHPLDAWEIDLTSPAQPHVTITHEAGLTRLTWQPAQGAVVTYEVWRSLRPYFVPGDSSSLKLGTVAAGTVPLQWADGAGVGDAALNCTYRVISLNAEGKMIGASQGVGEFDFALIR